MTRSEAIKEARKKGTGKEKKCKICKEKFITTSPNQKYCKSLECAKKIKEKNLKKHLAKKKKREYARNYYQENKQKKQNPVTKTSPIVSVDNSQKELPMRLSDIALELSKSDDKIAITSCALLNKIILELSRQENKNLISSK